MFVCLGHDYEWINEDKPRCLPILKKKNLKIKYTPEADVLILILREDPPVDAIEEPGGVIVSYGENGEPVTVEFLNASARQLIRSGERKVTIQSKR